MKKKVWVIDDDPIYQIIANKVIQKSEMFSEAESFKNGKTAIDALNGQIKNTESLPDLILLDINMPIMDGWEFMEKMTTIKPLINKQILIYIVSSSIAQEDKTMAKNHPDILGYLSKPLSIDDLVLIASND
ncbi:response regulator [Flavobacterium acetivorans]|uniref:response regulator n=1 Tax=Flavobacterium acetivorans TaxID=2893883 RepID=UPI001E569835|nr:response regulator [Flavobacterium sp. F-29]UFH34728.1 response regulator [Flavobacterium sp. F-29]